MPVARRTSLPNLKAAAERAVQQSEAGDIGSRTGWRAQVSRPVDPAAKLWFTLRTPKMGKGRLVMPKKKRPGSDFEIVEGSGNIFRDLGFDGDEPAELMLRSILFEQLRLVITNSGMTQGQIAEKLGTNKPKVAQIISGNMSDFSLQRIARYLLMLKYDICLSVRKASPDRNEGKIMSGINLVGLE